jgi:hypothetical protein
MEDLAVVAVGMPLPELAETETLEITLQQRVREAVMA